MWHDYGVFFGKVHAWKTWEDCLNDIQIFFVKLSLCTFIDKLTENVIQMMKHFVSPSYLILKSPTTLEIKETGKKMVLSK